MAARKKRHTPEQIIRKLRDSDAMLSVGKTIGQLKPALQDLAYLPQGGCAYLTSQS